MTYDRNELDQMTLQRLSYVLPQDETEEELLKDVFEKRASVSTYQTLTTIDVKQGWQEKIIQKYVDQKRESMPPENPAQLTPEEEANLDTAFVTKDKELELQATLDARNAKRKGIMTVDEPEETTEFKGTGTIEADGTTTAGPIEVVSVKKRGRPAKQT